MVAPTRFTSAQFFGGLVATRAKDKETKEPNEAG
jgi:hypothetical protein